MVEIAIGIEIEAFCDKFHGDFDPDFDDKAGVMPGQG